MSRAWHEVTKHSYVVDVRAVVGKFGAAAYLCKYLIKQYDGSVRQSLENRGFLRRFTTSRNWPKGGQMMRRGTLKGDWKVIGWEKSDRWLDAEFMSRGLPEMEQVGTDMAKAVQEDRKFWREMKKHDSS